MNPETIEKIKETLNPLAEKLGQGAEFAYESIYRQVIAEAIVYGSLALLFLAILTILTIVLFKKLPQLRKAARKNHERMYKHLKYTPSDEIYGTAWAWAPLAIGWVFWLIIGTCTLVESALTLLNPHYYAIQRILEIVQLGGQL